MQALAGIAFLCLLLSAWVVGVRMLRLARVTGQLPEKLLGAMLLSLMGLGYPLAIGAQAEAQLGLTAAKFFQLVSNLLIDLGFLLAFLFTWRVFRANSSLAKGVCGATAAIFVVHLFGAGAAIGPLLTMDDAVEATRSWALLAIGPGSAGLFWSAFESLRYRGMLMRRATLGLADPALCNRFLLWGVMGLVSGISGLVNLLLLQTGVDLVTDPFALMLTSLTGVAQSALLYLAFMPPAAFVRWLQEGTDRSQGDTQLAP